MEGREDRIENGKNGDGRKRKAAREEKGNDVGEQEGRR